jgi:3-hydroxyacyl-[acyl-carrier-protein] dehydratase
MRLEFFQMVDRLSALDLDARTVAAECVVPDESTVFEGHFPGHPIMPGVLMIETMAQTGGWLVMALLRFRRMAFLAQVKEAKLRRFVSPGEALHVAAELLHDGSGYAMAAGRIVVGGKQVADAEFTYRVLPFPNETLRAGMLAVARRVGVPEALLADEEAPV